MQFLRTFGRYWFYPNPGHASYGDTGMMTLLLIGAALIAASVAIRLWRRKMPNPVLKKLSKSWPSAALWLGIADGILVVCRVEQIQFLAIRFWWILWFVGLFLYVVIQARLYRTRFYEVVPTVVRQDPREKYLPKPKKK